MWTLHRRRLLAASSCAFAGTATAWCKHSSDTESTGLRVKRESLISCAGGKAELHAHYDLQGSLGRGGFGSVVRALHRSSGFMRAIKAVTTTAEDSSYISSRLVEVEALQTLDHPNIVKLYEYYYHPEEDTLFLVEEFLGGGTLEQRLGRQRGGRFNADGAAVALRQMLRALFACHAHGLAHRDLKEDNFAYDQAGDEATLKLIDFGLSLGTASGLPVNDENEKPNDAVKAAGTLDHSAPETLPKRDDSGQKLKLARYGTAADVWSIGTILFRMLTGQPFLDLDMLSSETNEFRRMMEGMMGSDKDLLDDVAKRVRNDAFLASRHAVARRYAPPAACDLLERMLHPLPEERITVAQALRHPYVTGSLVSRPILETVQPERRRRRAELSIKNARAFAAAPLMHRVAVLVEALGPTDDPEIHGEYLAFRAADENGDGVLGLAECANALRAAGVEPPDDLPAILRGMNTCADGEGEGGGFKVELVEFVAATMEPRLCANPQLMRAAFRLLDSDGDGFITHADVLKHLDAPGTGGDALARDILQSAKPDDRGRVDLERFCALIAAPADVASRSTS